MGSILAGATGLVGGHLAGELASAGDDVTALVRRQSAALNPSLRQLVCDYTRLDALTAIAAETVFCALGTTIAKAGSRQAFRLVDYDAILALGRFGRRCGARRFALVSSVGAGPGSSNFYLKVKGEVERDLATLGYDSLLVFRPSFLLGERSESRSAEAVGAALAKAVGWMLPGPLSRYRAIEAAVVARAMVRATRQPPAGTRIYHYRDMLALAGGASR